MASISPKTVHGSGDESRFAAGMRAVFGTSKAQSDAQIEAFQEANRKKRQSRKKTK